MEKMIVSNTLIPISISLEVLAFLGMLVRCLVYFTAELTAKLIINYPNIACFLFSSLHEYLVFVPLIVSVLTLVVFRTLRCHWPTVYNALDHDRVSAAIFIGIPIASFLSAVIQLSACQHVCREGIFSIYREKVSRYTNITVLPEVEDNLSCWVPIAEVGSLVTLVMFILSVAASFMRRVEAVPNKVNIRLPLQMDSINTEGQKSERKSAGLIGGNINSPGSSISTISEEDGQIKNTTKVIHVKEFNIQLEDNDCNTTIHQDNEKSKAANTAVHNPANSMSKYENGEAIGPRYEESSSKHINPKKFENNVSCQHLDTIESIEESLMTGQDDPKKLFKKSAFSLKVVKPQDSSQGAAFVRQESSGLELGENINNTRNVNEDLTDTKSSGAINIFVEPKYICTESAMMIIDLLKKLIKDVEYILLIVGILMLFGILVVLVTNPEPDESILKRALYPIICLFPWIFLLHNEGIKARFRRIIQNILE